MEKRGKKGQFFLIAALIIITILLSFVTYKSRVEISPVKYRVYDLGKELDLETAEVMDYGIYTPQTAPSQVFENWARSFSSYHEGMGQETFIFVYSDEEGNVRGIRFSRETTGSVSLVLGDVPVELPSGQMTEIDLEDLEEGNVNIQIGSFSTMFDYDPEKEKFYFIIKGEGGEIAQKQGE